MKSFKILLTIIMACVLCFGCCACGNRQDSGAASASESSSGTGSISEDSSAAGNEDSSEASSADSSTDSSSEASSAESSIDSSSEAGSTDGSSESDSDEAAEEPSSETAMDNFVSRLNAGDYVVDVKGFLKTSVCSPELAYFDYEDGSYEDIAFITLNNETFQGTLDEKQVTDIAYVSTENAVQTAGYVLPNYWIEASEDNMWNLFYNNQEKPLEFVSYEDTVKMTLISLAGYGYSALDLMHEVYMTLDAEDPSTVRFTAEVDDDPAARISYEDLDLTLVFGASESDPRIDQWLSDPDYPVTRASWDDDDLFYLNSVFLPGYGADALPFPDFASYALVIDEEVFNNTESILYTDVHGTEKDVEDYVKTLLDSGFTEAEVQQEDGSSITVYRRVLREDYRCYVEAYPYYDEGFVLEARPYYDNPKYDSLEDINKVIRGKGFAELPENAQFTGWYAEDTAAERSESWLYFFDYDICLDVLFHYEDEEMLRLYLKNYGDELEEKGYIPGNFSDEEDWECYGQYNSAKGGSIFKYNYTEEEDTVILQFRNEKEISAEDAEKRITDAGIPAPDLPDDVFCRDIAGYHRMTRGFDGRIYLMAQMSFDSAEEAGSFLDEYTAVLEDAGFYKENPEVIGSLKQNAYYNEEEDSFVAFDCFEEDRTEVNFDFVSNT